MARRNRWTLFSAALLAQAVGAADPHLPLADWPVADTKLVVPAEYRKAASLAARGGAPLDIALGIAGAFEGSTQHIVQMNERGEAPSATRISVVRDGLLDDAVRGERWDIALSRTTGGRWRIEEVRRAWRCRRGEFQDRFATVRCP